MEAFHIFNGYLQNRERELRERGTGNLQNGESLKAGIS